MAHRIIELRALADPDRELTVNVGLVAGGTASNIVPDHATATFEFRAFRPEVVRDTQAAIARIVATPVVPDTVTTVRLLGGSPPLDVTPASTALAGVAQAIAADLGFPLRVARTGGGSDGSYAAGAGSPVLDGLGPIGGLDHSPGEWLELASVTPRIALLAGLIVAAGERTGAVAALDASRRRGAGAGAEARA
jgi:glutamate carboxypeptidase